MSSLSKKQKLVVILMGVSNVIVLLCLCIAITYSLQNPSPPTPDHSAALSTSGPTSVPTEIPFPTWTPTPTSTPHVRLTATLKPLREEDAETLDAVEWDVANLRGLTPLRPVARYRISTQQLRWRFTDMFIGEDAAREAHTQVLVLSTLDFMSPHVDLLEMWKIGFTEGIAGFYLPGTEEIYVITGDYSVGAMEQIVFAHEYGHALVDQHFDLETLGLDVTGDLESTDRLLGVKALVEGDATLVEEQWIYAHITQADALEIWNDIVRGIIYSSNPTEPVPRVLGELSTFPYTYGRDFVTALHDQQGWPAVNAAYADPPVSTEHILHPERYLAGDQPIPVSLIPLTDTLGSDWRLVHDDVGGEFLVRLYLENHLSAPEAVDAAEGWGGDRCSAYYNEGTEEVVLVWSIAWDTVSDANQFIGALVDYADARFGHSADDITDSGWTCWEGRDALCTFKEGNRVTLAIGPNRGYVDRVLDAFASE
jgi:hypothetical protein